MSNHLPVNFLSNWTGTDGPRHLDVVSFSKNSRIRLFDCVGVVGELNFEIIQKNVEDVRTVTEDEIVNAMRMIWERMKIIIEPSCAVPFAVLWKNREEFAGKKIGIILTGGNVDLANLPF